MVKRIYFICVLLFLVGAGHIKAQENGYLTVKRGL
jgi:hypothetical protein